MSSVYSHRLINTPISKYPFYAGEIKPTNTMFSLPNVKQSNLCNGQRLPTPTQPIEELDIQVRKPKPAPFGILNDMETFNIAGFADISEDLRNRVANWEYAEALKAKRGEDIPDAFLDKDELARKHMKNELQKDKAQDLAMMEHYAEENNMNITPEEIKALVDRKDIQRLLNDPLYRSRYIKTMKTKSEEQEVRNILQGLEPLRQDIRNFARMTGQQQNRMIQEMTERMNQEGAAAGGAAAGEAVAQPQREIVQGYPVFEYRGTTYTLTPSGKWLTQNGNEPRKTRKRDLDRRFADEKAQYLRGNRRIPEDETVGRSQRIRRTPDEETKQEEESRTSGFFEGLSRLIS